mgnify:CR=1 FL=1
MNKLLLKETRAHYQRSHPVNSHRQNILNTLFDNYAYDIVSNAQTGASETNPGDCELKNLDNVLLIDRENYNNVHTNLLNMGICLSDYFHPVSKNYTKELLAEERVVVQGFSSNPSSSPLTKKMDLTNSNPRVVVKGFGA